MDTLPEDENREFESIKKGLEEAAAIVAGDAMPASLSVRGYRVVVEKAPNNYAAYVPDLPGCVATGANFAEVVSNMEGAIDFHLEGLSEDKNEALGDAK